MKDLDKIREAIDTLPEDTVMAIKAKLRGHLTLIRNTEAKEKTETIDDFLHKFKKIDLA